MPGRANVPVIIHATRQATGGSSSAKRVRFEEVCKLLDCEGPLSCIVGRRPGSAAQKEDDEVGSGIEGGGERSGRA